MNVIKKFTILLCMANCTRELSTQMSCLMANIAFPFTLIVDIKNFMAYTRS